MNTVNEIAISIAADIAALKSSMRQAETTVAGSMRAIEEKIGAVNNTLGLFGAGLSAAATVAFIKNAIDAADAMDELSQKIGVSVEDLAGLQLAFKFGSLEGEALQQAMTKLASAAADGNDGFKALGITATNTDGSLKSTREMLAEVADKFQGLDDGAQKTALAVDIFGKSGANLIPLLNGGSESLAEFDAMAKQMGLTISTETAAKAAEFNDTVDLLLQGVSGLGMQLASDLLPTLQSLAEKFLLAFSQGDRLSGLSGALAGSMKVIASAVMIVVDAFRFAVNTVGGFVDMVSAIISGDYKKAQEIASKTTQQNMSIIGESVKSVTALFEQSGGQTVKALNQVSDGQGTVVTNVKAAEEAAKAAAAQEKQRQKIINDVTESLQQENATLELTLKLGRSLTDSEKERIKVLQRLGGVMTQEIDQLLTKNKTLEESVRKQEELKKVLEKVQEIQEKASEAAQKETEQIVGRTKQLELEISQIGLKSDALAELTAQSLQAQAAEKRRLANVFQTADDPTPFFEYMKQADELERQTTLTRVKSAKEVAQTRIEEERRANQESVEGFLELFKDVSVKSADQLADDIKRALEIEFRTYVLRVGVEAIVGVDSKGNATGGGILGSLGQASISGAINAGFNKVIGGLGSAAFGSAAAYGAAVPGLTSAAAGSQAALLASQTAEFGAAGLASTAAAGGSAAGAAASSVLAAAPYIAAAILAYQLFKSKKIPASSLGGGDFLFGADGGRLSEVSGDSAGITDLVNSIINPISNQFVSLVDQLGGVSQAFVVSAGGNTGKDGKNPNFSIRTGIGGVESTVAYEAGLNETSLATESLRTVLTLLRSTDLPDNIEAVVRGVDLSSASFEKLQATLSDIQAIDYVNDNFKNLEANLVQLSGASVESIKRFFELSGGLEGFQQGLSAFQQTFYTETERFDLATKNVVTALGSLGVPLDNLLGADGKFNTDARSSLRNFAQSLDLTTESGARTFNAILNLSGVLGEVLPQLQEAGAALGEVGRSAADIAQERLGLENRLLTLQGNTNELRRRELEELDATNRGILQQIFAFEDARAAQEELRREQEENQRAQEQALSRQTQAIREQNALIERMAGLGGQVKQFIDSIAGEVFGGSIQDQGVTEALYRKQLALARMSDEEALGGISSIASQVIKQARDSSASFIEFQRKAFSVRSELASLPAVSVFENKSLLLLSEIRDSGISGFANLDANGDLTVNRLEALIGKTSGIAEAVRSSLASSFDKLNLIADQGITKDEFSSAFGSFGLGSKLDLLYAGLDIDNNSLITRLESQFGKLISTDDALRLAVSNGFNRLDTTANGLLDFNELKAGLGGIATDEQIRRFMAESDLNGDSMINTLEGMRGKLNVLEKAIRANLIDLFDNVAVAARESITQAEFNSTFGSFGLGASLNTIFKELDTDGNRIVDKMEAVRIHAMNVPTGVKDQLTALFGDVSAASREAITQSEFNTAFGSFGLGSRLDTIFRELDVNGDGTISRLEAGNSIENSTLSATNTIRDLTYEVRAMAIRSAGSGIHVRQSTDERWANPIFETRDYLNVMNQNLANLLNYGSGFAGGFRVTSVNRSGEAAFFRDGGLVTGPGTGTSDSIPAYLSNREFVMPANRVSQFGVGFMESIRAGQMPFVPMSVGMNMSQVVAVLNNLVAKVQNMSTNMSVEQQAIHRQLTRSTSFIERVTEAGNGMLIEVDE